MPSSKCAKFAALLAISGLLLTGLVTIAEAQQEITITATIRSIGIELTRTSHDFGFFNLGENRTSFGAYAAGQRSFGVKNSGNIDENFTVRSKQGDNATSPTTSHVWCLRDSYAEYSGVDNFMVKHSTPSDDNTAADPAESAYNILPKYANPATLAGNVDNGTYRWLDLELCVPKATTETAPYSAHQMGILVGAVAAE